MTMARSLATALVTAALVGVLAAATNAEVEPIVVTRDTQALPSGCTPRETAGLLLRFAQAVNTGDAGALDRVFAIEDPPGRVIERNSRAFVWFSVTEGQASTRQPWRHVVFYDRVDVFPYFAERRRHKEHWDLVSVAVAPSHTLGAAGITYTIRRTAAGLPSWLSPLSVGKGAIDCTAKRIYVWSMGQNDHSVDIGIACPRPPDWSPGAAIVACSQGPNAQAIATGFQLEAGSADLPRPCSPTTAFRKVRAALSAYNAGLDTAFSKHFGRSPLLLSGGAELRLRSRIGAFVRTRYSAGEGSSCPCTNSPIQVRPGGRLYARTSPHAPDKAGRGSGGQCRARLPVRTDSALGRAERRCLTPPESGF